MIPSIRRRYRFYMPATHSRKLIWRHRSRCLASTEGFRCAEKLENGEEATTDTKVSPLSILDFSTLSLAHSQYIGSEHGSERQAIFGRPGSYKDTDTSELPSVPFKKVDSTTAPWRIGYNRRPLAPSPRALPSSAEVTWCRDYF